jgi:hypothetical protein
LEETQIVAMAVERGRLSVVVRNPDDPGVQNDIPDFKASALVDAKGRVQTAGRARGNANAPVRIEESSLP